jgi:hypothetical protein
MGKVECNYKKDKYVTRTVGRASSSDILIRSEV